jgi:hypothetical protein
VHSGWLEPDEVAIPARASRLWSARRASSLHNGYGNFLFGKLPELLALGVNVAIGRTTPRPASSTCRRRCGLPAAARKEVRINRA